MRPIYTSSHYSFTDKVLEVFAPKRAGRAVAFSTAVGLSILVLHLVKATSSEDESSSSLLDHTVSLIWNYFRKASKRVTERTEHEDEDIHTVTHQGSCHCESIYFSVHAPEVLTVQQGRGKILYPQCVVNSSRFNLVFGSEYLRVYHVSHGDETIAYSFCRNCAVHIVNATDKDESCIAFNVDCLRPETIKRLDTAKTNRQPSMASLRARSRKSSMYSQSDLESVGENAESNEWRDKPKEIITPALLRHENSVTPDKSTLEPHLEEIKADLDNQWPSETESTYSGVTTDTGTFDVSVEGSYIDSTASVKSTTNDAATREKLRRFMKKHMTNA